MGQIRKTGLLWLALSAGVVATICDKIHVITGALSYPDPVMYGQPWWCLPGFILAFLLMGVIYLKMAGFCKGRICIEDSVGHVHFQAFTETLLIFTLIYFLSGFGSGHPVLLNFLFYGTFLVRLGVTEDRIFILMIAIILAIGGVAGEGFLSLMGLVTYKRPDFFLVPAWLGGLYLHGAFALRAGVRFFVY